MNKRVKLAFSAIFGGAFLIGGMSAFVGALMQQSSTTPSQAELSDAEVHLIGMVAAFHCHAKAGSIDREAGLERLGELIQSSGINPDLIENNTVQTVGWELSQRLDANCSSNGFDEADEIKRLASAQPR